MSFWQFRKEAAKSTHASLSNLIAKLKLGNLKKLSLPWYVGNLQIFTPLKKPSLDPTIMPCLSKAQAGTLREQVS